MQNAECRIADKVLLKQYCLWARNVFFKCGMQNAEFRIKFMKAVLHVGKKRKA
jgi:hypothetical protein